MAYQFADYSEKSQRLVTAGEQLLESLQDPDVDRSMAIHDVEAAAQVKPISEVALGFGPAASVEPKALPARPSADDALSGLLLEVQAANVLLSSGIALNEHGGGSQVTLLNQSLAEIQNSQLEVKQVLVAREQLAFAPKSGVKSSSIDAAKKTFRDNANGVLKDVVDDATSVVNAVFEQLKKLDGAKILEGIDKLGESFQGIAAAGQLIRQGLDKLKKVLDALTNLFGKDLLASMKKKVAGIWKKVQAGEYTHDLLAATFDLKGAEARVLAVLAQSDLDLDAIDNASNALPAVSEKSKSNFKLLRSLISALVLAATLVGFLHLAVPWLPLVTIGLYAAVIAATVLVGMDYCDSGRVLNWVRGVGQIANEIQPAAAGRGGPGPGRPKDSRR